MITKHHLKHRIFALTAGVLTFAAAHLQAQDSWDVVYRQGFANDSGSFQQSGGFGWMWFHTENATPGAANRIHFQSGSSPVVNVNAPAPLGEEISAGYWTMASSSIQFAFTELAVSRALDVRLGMDMYHNAGPDDPWRFAVRFADDWYVSETAFQNPGAWENYQLELTEDSVWLALDFVSGETLAVTENSVSLAAISGDITAAGFFGEPANNQNNRIDNFEVAVIPEPGTLALLLGLAGMAVVAVGRRFRAGGRNGRV